jgi:hypothetical protein
MKFDGDDVIVIFEKYEDIIKDIKDLLTILHTQYSKLSLMSVVRCNNRLFFTFIKNPKESGEADIITWVFFERRFCKFTTDIKLNFEYCVCKIVSKSLMSLIISSYFSKITITSSPSNFIIIQEFLLKNRPQT